MNKCEIIVDATSTGHHSFKLDERCWQCEERGRFAEMDCDLCNGTGYILTGQGDVLMAFIKRHLKDDDSN